MIREETDRRWKLLTLHAADVIDLFLPWGRCLECFSQLALDPEEIPEGYRIDDVWYDNMAQGWRLLIYHPSFDIVPPAEIPPPVTQGYRAFYLPRFNSLKEATAVATWMYKSETDRLREMLGEINT